ncbi:HAMP domain-containing histidine kinase [Xanthobacter autotrophicus]|uniref:sensor histidine kinase n=1 Tax=Xanthobacter TaxID=279 RepID=UPI0024AA0914|nr:HAMP domain-containing sensor histidine kinase [Xanthobacter autotrophicus]MDI4666349.1 HAMP domain-containing histidine kinase [Xanthobacter autotrophicus]
MSGPFCPPLDAAASSPPEPAAQADGLPLPLPPSIAPSIAPSLARRARSLAGPCLLAALAVFGLLLAGGALAGLAGAAAGGTAALIAVSLLVLRARRLEAALRRAEARARAAEADARRAAAENSAKSRFLAEMSHELRTPLNTVMGFSEMMADEVLGPHRVTAYASYARDIHASGQHLLALADDLLDLARIESGHRTLMETPVRLDALAEECVAMMRPLATGARVTLSAVVDGAPRLWGDERALRQIALNLLANAVKFTPPDGAVRLLAGIGTDGVPFVAVEDTGPGIAERELPFGAAHPRESRLDVATGRGAGLGLAIVRGLAGLHEGTLTLARRPGGGTRAEVTFPPARALPANSPGL